MTPNLVVQLVTELQSLGGLCCAAAFPPLQAVEYTQGSWLRLRNESPQFSLQEMEV